MKEHHFKLKQYAFRLMRNVTDAEDLYQDTSIRIYINMDKMKNEKTFLSWAMKIMKRLFLDKLRTASRRISYVSSDAMSQVSGHEFEVIDHGVTIEEDFMKEITAEREKNRMRKLINSLQPDFKEALSLNIYGTRDPLDIENSNEDGLPYAEIVELTNLENGTLRSRLHRAKKALAKQAIS